MASPIVRGLFLALVVTVATSERHPSFPPAELVDTPDRGPLAAWYRARPYVPKSQSLSDRQKELLRWSAAEYITARKAGSVTCEEYARTLVDQMMSFKDAQQFILSTYDLSETIVDAARKMDQRAAENGVESIGPLYGLPVPMKGTMATTDFPSSAGSSVLDTAVAKKDAAFTALFKQANALAMGKTNVPDFAASWVTMNPRSGRTMNMYNGQLTAGGSSGGAGSAVSAHVAPVAVTEDTGGSTRHPAFQNQNFGYDPTRNHYPNQGNPGVCYTNDQVGLNARSFEDILLIDAAVLGTRAQHQAARSASENKKSSDFRVGTPLFPFVDLTLPGDAFNFWGVRNHTVSTSLRAKYEHAKAALRSADVQLLQEEWPEVDSKWFARPINSVLDTLFGNRRINGLDYDGIGAPLLHSFTGQISEWVLSYLGEDVSMKAIWDASADGGDGHSPRGFYGMSAFTDESQFRATGHVQAEKLRVWNSYFEKHGVDVIMTPGQTCDAISFAEMANSSVPLRVLQSDGSYKEEPSQLVQCNLVAYFAFKDVPIPKVMVPTGLDSEGRPTGVMFWGRGVPEERLFDDDFAKTHDIEFLHTVGRMVELMYKETDLQRKEAPILARSLARGQQEL